MRNDRHRHEQNDLLNRGVHHAGGRLRGYDLVGFVSGIAYGKYYPQLLRFMEVNLPTGKKVLFLHTAGDPRKNHNSAAKAIAGARQYECMETYFCKGLDTYGPFKLIGGNAR